MIWLIRLIILVPLLFSIQQAYAGVSLFQGQTAFRESRFQAAAEKLDQAYLRNKSNPKTLYLLGRSLLELGLNNKDETSLRRAVIFFHKFVFHVPSYGRAWALLGIAEYHVKTLEERELSEQDGKKITGFFLKAILEEPNNAWALHSAGIYTLKMKKHLTVKERTRALSWLRQSVDVHHYHEKDDYLNRGSKYLEPTLNFLWNEFRIFSLLKWVTPFDRASYAILLKVMEDAGIWKFYPAIEEKYRSFQSEEYEQSLEQAEKLVEVGAWQKAYRFYRKAYWTDKNRSEAQAGILALEKRTKIDFSKGRLFKRVENLEETEVKVKGAGAQKISANQWWGEKGNSKILKTNEKLGASVNIGSTKGRFQFQARGGEGVVAVSLLDGFKRRPLGVFYVSGSEWSFKDIHFEGESGKRWLELKLIKGPAPIEVELGDMEIFYS